MTNGPDHDAIMELKGDVKVMCSKIDTLLSNNVKQEKKMDTFIAEQHKTCRVQVSTCSKRIGDEVRDKVGYGLFIVICTALAVYSTGAYGYAWGIGQNMLKHFMK
jgi:hypothetical protein